MDPQTPQQSEGEVKVETNNVQQVLQYFDDEGHLTDKDSTRLAIPCGICQERNLAILNYDKDERSRGRHESYAVLKCGHAFGYCCLHKWLLKNATCPSCRQNPFCPRQHFVMSDLFGDAGPREQHEEIKDIRKLLQRPGDCGVCDGRDAAPAPRPPQPPWRDHQLPEAANIVILRSTNPFGNPFAGPFGRFLD